MFEFSIIYVLMRLGDDDVMMIVMAMMMMMMTMGLMLITLAAVWMLSRWGWCCSRYSCHTFRNPTIIIIIIIIIVRDIAVTPI